MCQCLVRGWARLFNSFELVVFLMCLLLTDFFQLVGLAIAGYGGLVDIHMLCFSSFSYTVNQQTAAFNILITCIGVFMVFTSVIGLW